ncbi:hypothetical protein [Janthinobacterium sp. YR213]|uniref:hypothetical protein n=1 Tax=Janthinobacterium sp. YR213 TaxID=1881027 RepID=UPI00088ACDB2|nr:hypothetical protein [Janthinobacterium sp. YR213]SDH80705.1 hypothetical protein SAMN05428968_4684 [Janthinobacterium sp. YR213]
MRRANAPINFRKDETLDRLAETLNVAQFVSFSPGEEIKQEYCRILGFEANHKFESIASALTTLLDRSIDCAINIRSFRPDDPRSHEFIYGIKNVDDALAAVLRIAHDGFNVIANETINVSDGGVSGVIEGGVIEFSPDDTPRCVEKPGLASLPRAWGVNILQTVYGFSIDVDIDDSYRLEFSVHPRPCGWKHTHVIGWELEKTASSEIIPQISWPNNFSRLIGDKAYGLLIAGELGLSIPFTTVISRRVAPFSFGADTSSAERWIRTCPREQVPGLYTTHHGWLDPFTLLANEDPSGSSISSVLAQHAVRAEFSGALIVDAGGNPLIEGTRGEGEALMLGSVQPEELPINVVQDVLFEYGKAFGQMGVVRFEWVHDGERAWIVQLHKGATSSLAKIIVPGEALEWRQFDVSKGIVALRAELELLGEHDGLLLTGRVGLTSHVADVLRKNNKPARFS